MTNKNIIFLDENEATLHEQILAKLVAQALLFKVRLEKECDDVKQEKKANAVIK